MKYFFSFLALFFSFNAFSQGVPCPALTLITHDDTIFNHLDTIHCGTLCATIHSVPNTNLTATTTYSVSPVAYAPFSYTAGTDALLSGGVMALSYDDNYSDIVNLPFNFCFFGNTYSQIVIGTNGNISFNTALATAYDPWPISGAMPGSNCAATENCIMAPWNDLYPPDGGTIKYASYGTAPCRQFVISWNLNTLFIPGTCSDVSTEQIVLYESSNIVEIYINHRAPCVAWNNGFAVTGIENNPGTLFYTPPLENGTTFTATNEGWRFTPTGASSGWTYTWYDSTGTTVIGTGAADSITVCPTVTSRYYVKATSVACTGVTISDSIKVVKSSGGLVIDSISFSNPTSCIANNGWIRFHGFPPGDTIIASYTYNGAAVGPTTIYSDFDSNLIFSSLPPGVYDLFMFTHDSCIAGPYGPYTLVAPPISISHETFTNPTICGKCDGSITLYGLLPSEPVTVSYSKDGVLQPVYSGTVGLDSTVHFNGLCAGNYTGFVATIGSCVTDGTPLTLTNPPPVPAAFTLTTKLHCNGDEVDVINTSTPPGYFSYWSWGDGSPLDSNESPLVTHIYSDAPGFVGTYTVTLTYNTFHNPACNSTFDTVISFNHPIDAHFTTNANAVCLGMPIHFDGTTISTNGPKFSWNFGDGSPFITDTSSFDYTYMIPGRFTTTLTVTDSIGCKAIYTDNFEVIGIDVHTGVHDTSVCLVDSMFLHSFPLPNPPDVSYTITWTPTNNIGSTNTRDTRFFGVGTYVYTVTVTTPPLVLNPLGCIATDTEKIVSYPPVTLTNVTASQTVLYGSSLQLNADGAVYYRWTPDNGSLNNNNINNPVAIPVDSVTIYTVYGMNTYGCIDSAFVRVSIDYTMNDAMPSAFTPNNDGLNDVFRITRLKYQKLVDFRIFNRWGQEVFQTSNSEVGWDGTFHGTPQDMGVYSYVIIVAMPGGDNKTYKGNVTLIR